MTGGRLAPYRVALESRDLRLLVLSFVVDSVGTWSSAVVVSIWVFERTGSLVLLAVQMAATWVPGLLAGPVGAVIADRIDRRTAMAASASACALVFAAMAAVIGAEGPVWIVLLLQAAGAVVATPHRPAAGALTPAVVDGAALPAANSLFATLSELVVIVGPVIGAGLLLLGAPWIGVASNAVSFAVAAAVAAALRVRSRGGATAGTSLLGQFGGGVRALAAAPTAAVLLVFAALDCLVANAYTVIDIPIGRHVGLGAGGYGLLLAASAVGGVLGAGAAERLAARPRLAPVIVGALVVQALPYALTAVTDIAVVALALQVVSGAGMIVVDVLALTAVQREVAPDALSRVLGLREMSVLTANLVGTFALAGMFAALPYAVVLVLLGLGVAATAAALSPLVVRADRRSAARTALLAGTVALFGRIPLLSPIPRSGLERLAASSRAIELAAGEPLIREGDPADAIYVLERGTLAIRSASTDARGVALPDVVAPDVVGEIGVLRGSARTATVTAATSVALLRVDAQAYLDALTPERTTLVLAGTPSVRLARTHPGSVVDPA